MSRAAEVDSSGRRRDWLRPGVLQDPAREGTETPPQRCCYCGQAELSDCSAWESVAVWSLRGEMVHLGLTTKETSTAGLQVSNQASPEEGSI